MLNPEKRDYEQLSLLQDKILHEDGLPVQKEGTRLNKTKSTGVRRDRKTLQDILLSEGLVAVRLSVESHNLEDLQAKLQQALSQNSVETRRRYAQLILLWFFPDGIGGLAHQVWQSYEDEPLETSILRYLYLAAEPLVGNCVAQCLYPLEEGILIPPAYFERHLRNALGEEPPANTLKRLKMNLGKLGFLDRSSSQGDRLNSITPDKTAFLILFHEIFSAIGPRTVEITRVLQNPFWKYLGIKSEQSVRAILREADGAGLLGKYVVADQLEQATTRFSLPELLNRKVRL